MLTQFLRQVLQDRISGCRFFVTSEATFDKRVCNATRERRGIVSLPLAVIDDDDVHTACARNDVRLGTAERYDLLRVT